MADESKLDKARAKARRARKKHRRARTELVHTAERLDRSKARTRKWKTRSRHWKSKAGKWKSRTKASQTQVEVLRDLNRQLTVDYRESRASDAAAIHFAAEAINAFAADAAALRAMQTGTEHTDYLDHLTFRLRQNLIEARQFLDQQGEAARAADLADLLNALPPDNTHR